MSEHEYHRQRVYRRFAEEGIDGFEAHQVLELVLFYCLPRQDTNPIAHRLIHHFGSISAVFDAPVEELEKVNGIGHRTAVFLTMFPAVWRRYCLDRVSDEVVLDSAKASGLYVRDLFLGIRREQFYLLILDSQCRLIRPVRLGEGTISDVSVQSRSVVEAALRYNAAQVVFAHNHPGGTTQPSNEDVICTRKLAVSLASVNIPVLDHIISSENDFFSFSQNNIMVEIKREVNLRITEQFAPYK